MKKVAKWRSSILAQVLVMLGYLVWLEKHLLEGWKTQHDELRMKISYPES